MQLYESMSLRQLPPGHVLSHIGQKMKKLEGN